MNRRPAAAATMPANWHLAPYNFTSGCSLGDSHGDTNSQFQKIGICLQLVLIIDVVCSDGSTANSLAHFCYRADPGDT